MARHDSLTATAVAIGGAVGATGRWGVGTLFDTALPGTAMTTFPWATFIVNVVGCLLIGVAAARFDRESTWWAFAVTGVLGGFTTMSAFAVELNGLADDQRLVLVIVYLVSTLVVGLAALLIGEQASSRSRPAQATP